MGIRKNKDEYAYVSFEIRKDFLNEIDKAVIDEELRSRSALIRHLLWAWLGEVKKSQGIERWSVERI